MKVRSLVSLSFVLVAASGINFEASTPLAMSDNSALFSFQPVLFHFENEINVLLCSLS